MKKRKIIILLILFIMVFFTSITYAETLSIENSAVQEVITFTNSPADRPQLEDFKHSATQNGITFEQAIEDYILEFSYKNNGIYFEEVTTLPSDITIDGITLSELEDLITIAKNEEISLEEAIDRYAWQSHFLEISDKLEEAYPHTFAGAVFETDGTGAWFAFKYDIPKEAIEIVSDLPATIKLFGNRGYSELDLKNTLNSIHYKIYSHEEIVNVSSYYDIETGKITVEAQPTDKIKPLELEKLKSQSLQAHSENNSINIDIKFVDKIDIGNESTVLLGGGYLGNCTAGFTLRNSTGSVGIATAGHCDGNSRTYRDHFGNTSTVFRLYWHQGTYGDLGMYVNANMNAMPFFYHNYGSGRFTTGTATPRVGTNVCNFGKETGYKCEKVYKTGLIHGNYGDQVVVYNHVTVGGDSGGPWFFGNTAYGIHSGKKPLNGVDRSRFSPISKIALALNRFQIYVQ